MKNYICHDCGAEEGMLHEYGCDMERCPFCGRQLISCKCCYKKLGVDVSKGTWAYSHGLTDEQSERWLEILNDKDRIPYIQPIVLCSRCGEKFPAFFGVPDEEWQKYVVPELQDKVLCWNCYSQMKTLFPNGWRNTTFVVKA